LETQRLWRVRAARSARRVALLGLLLPVATACNGPGLFMPFGASVVYDEMVDNGIVIPAVYTGTPDGLDAQFVRREVTTPDHIPNDPGTIVVDTPNRYLYLVQANGRSMRYGIGVGREGFAWQGEAVIKAKQAWPTWTPTPEMLKRDPSARPYAKGMPGGLGNPLGARALYLFVGDKDTLYRIHGTTEQWSIGHAVSSGCVRLLDQDVIDLYRRVPIGTKVVVLADPTLIRGTPTVVAPPRGTAPAAPGAVSPEDPVFPLPPEEVPDAGAPA
jgi:lipoprotein-anchoring transpeptidase ErfK/SrfK